MSDEARAAAVHPDADGRDLPGSDGEHDLQARFDTTDRTHAFYEGAMQSSLTDRMRSFLAQRWLGVVGWLGADGPRATVTVGDPGMVQVLDAGTVAWPTDRLIGDAPRLDGPQAERHLSLTTVDWWDSTVGLHVNGVAERRSDRPPGASPADATDWFVLDVEEAYIHCAKHLPRLAVDERPSADRFMDVVAQRTDRLVPRVRRFVDSRILGFLATADDSGETDVSPRLGPEGFVQSLDDTTLAWPEYRGNGVHASLGNVVERPSASLLFVDWWTTDAVVQVSGDASIRDDVAGAVDPTGADRTKTWVVLDVDAVRTYVRPALPRLSVEAFDPPWGTDDDVAKKSGFFT